jgi:hypothetical protein
MSDEQKSGFSKFRPGIGYLTDLYIDVLGSLVPGLFTTVIGLGVLMWSGFLIYGFFCSVFDLGVFDLTDVLSLKNDLFGTDGALNGFWWMIVVISYLVGFVFYRQDPKVPDFISAKKAYKNTSKNGREMLAVQPRNGDNVCSEDAEYPYYFLYEYLEGRGLNHLSKYIPWRGKKKDTWHRRTKMYINILKIRLQFLVPEKCKDIVRGEAHVRLATSVWYSTSWLIKVCIADLITIVSLFIFRQIFPIEESALLLSFIALIVFDLFVGTFAFYLRYKVEKFVHYLRVREIVYVLETAYFAEENGFKIKIEDLISG